jgi:dTDP-4-dehydrorhamnose 3,5-epimerase
LRNPSKGLRKKLNEAKQMNLIKTKIKDLLILEPKVFTDGRGYFFESYNKKTLEPLIGKEYNFIQDNESKSSMA